jgi:SAM-dependent methyltransferase
LEPAKFWDVIEELAEELTQAKVPYQFIESASLCIQGVDLPTSWKISIQFQWDLLENTYELFKKHNPSSINRSASMAQFQFMLNNVEVTLACNFNTTIKTDPYRISVQVKGKEIWCQSLYSYEYSNQLAYVEPIHQFLHAKQLEMSNENENAWNQNNYLALLNRYGNPADIVGKIKENPKWRLHPFYKYMSDLQGKNVVHLMGSNGVKGVAMAILGGNVTVVDFSKENQRFATELAIAADVPLHYLVDDVLKSSERLGAESADIVLMELGVLHYFIDLVPLADVINTLLKVGGTFILHEFHPVSTKLITSTGKKHKVTGNYFDPSIKEGNVAFTKHMPTEEQSSLTKVYQRHWTLGEIITSFAKANLYVEVVEEEPNHKLHDIGLPKTFTLVARKIE